MKLISLEFQNIASFSDKVIIDFEDDPLKHASIYAIVGETGSGKSTILDAISLALYGDAPRFNNGTRNKVKVYMGGETNQSPNDPRNIMRRGSKECHIKLAFSNNGVTYHASWSTSRSRKNFGATERSLAVVNSDGTEKNIVTISKGGIKPLTDPKFEEAVGLNYEQFLRTILLSQGEFASFLKAEDIQKAEILEQITGTQIYRAIGEKISKHNKEAKEQLENVRNEINAFAQNKLEDTELQSVTDELSQLKNKFHEIEDNIKKVERASDWLAQKQDCETNISNEKNNYDHLKVKWDSCAQARFQLATHDVLQQNAGEQFAKYKNAKQQMEQAEISLEKAKNERQQLETVKARKSQLYDKLKEKLLQAQTKANDAKPRIQEARRLKTQMSEVRKTLDEKTEQKNVYVRRKTQAEEDIKDKQSELQLKQEALGKARSEFEPLKRHAAMVAHSNGLEEILKNLKRQQKELRDGQGVIQSCKAKLNTFIAQSEKLKATRDQAIAQVCVRCEHLKQLIIQEEEDVQRCERLESKLKAELDAYMQMANETVEGLRSLLAEGQQCPVCGSTEHPLTDGKILEEVDAKLREQVQSKKKECKDNSNKLSKLNNNLHEHRNELTLLKATLERYDYTHLPDACPPNDGGGQISSEQLCDRINKAVAYLDKLIQEKTLLQAKLHAAVTSEQKLSNEIRESMARVVPMISIDSWQELWKNDCDQVIKRLAEITEQYESLTKNIEDSETAISGLNLSITHLKTNLGNYEKDVEKAEKSCEDESKRLNGLREQFDEVLDGKDPDELEKELNVSLKLCEDNAKSQMIDLENVRLDLTTLGGSIKKLMEIIGDNQDVLKELLPVLHDTVSTVEGLGIDEKADFLTTLEQYLGSDKDWLDERAQIDKLKSEIESSTSRLAVHRETFSRLNLSEDRTELTADALRDKHQELSAKKDDWDREVKEKERIINIHNQAVSNIGDRQQAFDAAQENCKNWSGLYKYLVGEQSGIKAVLPAQVTTLSVLVNQANLQLRHMTQRYSIRQFPNSLTLQIIDHEQGDTERFVNSLSGGETFVISLSLALALSQISSNNVRFDDIFIDEGFGSLSDDVLSTVINALSNLNDIQGKQVGVISHTEQMRERIPVQIHVNKTGVDGRSTITVTDMAAM